MNEIRSHSRPSSPRSAKRDAAIEAFLQEHASNPNQDLLAQMMVTLCRLARDGAGRGEMKILNTALKELRYAFKIFAPYSHIPKVTIFGSSRTAEDHPEYLQAQQFAERIEKEGWMVITGAGDGLGLLYEQQLAREEILEVDALGIILNDVIGLLLERQRDGHAEAALSLGAEMPGPHDAEAVVLFPGGLGTQDENCKTSRTATSTSSVILNKFMSSGLIMPLLSSCASTYSRQQAQ